MESTIYTVDGKEFELQHHGIKGMKWGRRKARPEAAGRTSSGKQSTDADEAARKEARRAKAKRAAKIGAALVAAGLAAYGAKKLHDVVRDKNYDYRMKEASKFLDRMKNHPLYRVDYTTPFEERHAADKRWEYLVKNIYDGASRQSDRDSFGRAAKNVLGSYLLDETRDRRRR